MHDEMQSELVAVQERMRDGIREEMKIGAAGATSGRRTTTPTMSSDQMTQQISTADALGKYESKMEKLKAGIDRRNDFISCPPSSTNLTNATSTTASVRADIARLRVVVDTVAKKLDRQHDRGQSEIWEKLALLKKQLVESVDRSTASCEETRAMSSLSSSPPGSPRNASATRSSSPPRSPRPTRG